MNTLWQDQAACTGHADLYEAADAEIARGATKNRPAADKALTLCTTCPVTTACLNAALATEHPAKASAYSIRGGLTPSQRTRLPRKAAA